MNTVILHGLGQGPADWEPVLRNLGGGAVCPDLFGLLQGREAVYENLYQAVSGFCGELEGPLCLCGLSLGGVLALQYAMEQPERVRALAVIGAQCVMPKGLLALQNAVFRLMPERCFRAMGLGKRGTIALCKSMTPLDLRGGLGRISCPVLAVCGTRDRANRRAAAMLAEGIPHAELAWVENAGHEVNADAPEELAALLRTFFTV